MNIDKQSLDISQGVIALLQEDGLCPEEFSPKLLKACADARLFVRFMLEGRTENSARAMLKRKALDRTTSKNIERR